MDHKRVLYLFVLHHFDLVFFGNMIFITKIFNGLLQNVINASGFYEFTLCKPNNIVLFGIGQLFTH